MKPKLILAAGHVIESIDCIMVYAVPLTRSGPFSWAVPDQSGYVDLFICCKWPDFPIFDFYLSRNRSFAIWIWLCDKRFFLAFVVILLSNFLLYYISRLCRIQGFGLFFHQKSIYGALLQIFLQIVNIFNQHSVIVFDFFLVGHLFPRDQISVVVLHTFRRFAPALFLRQHILNVENRI